jgi:hypothetical protein
MCFKYIIIIAIIIIIIIIISTHKKFYVQIYRLCDSRSISTSATSVPHSSTSVAVKWHFIIWIYIRQLFFIFFPSRNSRIFKYYLFIVYLMWWIVKSAYGRMWNEVLVAWIISALFTITFSIFIKNTQNNTLHFGSKLLASSGKISNPKTQLAKNVTRVST